jgi:hypothetical protein
MTLSLMERVNSHVQMLSPLSLRDVQTGDIGNTCAETWVTG